MVRKGARKAGIETEQMDICNAVQVERNYAGKLATQRTNNIGETIQAERNEAASAAEKANPTNRLVGWQTPTKEAAAPATSDTDSKANAAAVQSALS